MPGVVKKNTKDKEKPVDFFYVKFIVDSFWGKYVFFGNKQAKIKNEKLVDKIRYRNWCLYRYG